MEHVLYVKVVLGLKNWISCGWSVWPSKKGRNFHEFCQLLRRIFEGVFVFQLKSSRNCINNFINLIPGITMCYQRPSVNHNANSNNNHFDQKPTHQPHSAFGHKWTEPYFDVTMPRNITSLVGKSAYLGCRVRNLGNKTVSTTLVLMFYSSCVWLELHFSNYKY